MTKLTRTQTRELAGWTGGVREESEPALAISDDKAGRLRAGENFVHQAGFRLVRRGGTARRLTFVENGITDVLAVAPWSPTGGLVVTHSAPLSRHYAHAITEAGGHALPAGTPGEAGSRVVLPSEWNSGTPARPQLVELFETAFVADRAETGTPRALLAVTVSGGAISAAVVVADLDGNAVTGAMRPRGVAVHNGVLFAWGWEDESIGVAPHLMRHSYLGRSPANADAWDADAYAILGAQGQPIRAARSGQGVLLVAKEAELYRLTGTPDALPGWQFGIQQVDNSRGAGCAGALALDLADNAWYGVGRAGPWRCDGASVELLRTGRTRSWGTIGDLARASVVHHPRRRAVCFSFVEAVRGGAPSVQWWWDLDRDCWMPDQRPTVRVHMCAAIAPAGVEVSAAPSALRQVLNNGAHQRTSVHLVWTLGRPDQATEVWLRSETTAAQLAATVPAGVAGVILHGLPPGALRSAQVRHVSATPSEFSPEIPVYTAVPSVRLALPSAPAARVTADVATSVTVVSENATENALARTQGVPAGVSAVAMPAVPRRSDAAALFLSATATRPAFPDAIESAPAAYAATFAWRTDGVSVPDGEPPIPTQVLDADAWSETAITVQVCPHATVAQILAVQWRRFGTGEWVTADLRVLAATADPYTVTVPGLVPGERWGVRVVFDPIGSGASLEQECFTAIPAPALVAGVVSGIMSLSAGTDVTVTVTPPNGAAGFDVLIGTIDQSVEALYQSVPGAPQAYTLAAAVAGRPTVLTCRARNAQWPTGLEWGAVAQLTLPADS